jgi:YbbR domain-containing protein
MTWIFHNFAWKLLSLFVAFGIWFVVMSSNSIELPKEVALDLDLPSGLVVANDVPDRVNFRLSGSKFFLRTVANSLDTIKIDLTKAKAGPSYYKIEKEAIHLPIGVKILSISPSTINLVLEPVEHRSVPVEVVEKNEVPNGYRLVRLAAMPKNVRIKGPRNAVEKISAVRSEPVDLADIPASLKWEVGVKAPAPNIVFDEEIEPKVSVEVEPTGSNFRVAGVPLKVNTKRSFTAKPEKVALYVNCPPNLIKTLTPERVKAYVDVADTRAGVYVREVKAELPPGVKLVRVVPDRVQIQLE